MRGGEIKGEGSIYVPWISRWVIALSAAAVPRRMLALWTFLSISDSPTRLAQPKR